MSAESAVPAFPDIFSLSHGIYTLSPSESTPAILRDDVSAHSDTPPAISTTSYILVPAGHSTTPGSKTSPHTYT